MKELNSILVVSMCTKHCLMAVQWGISLAKNYNTKLFITHIIHNPFGLEGWNLPAASIKTIEEEYLTMTQKAKKDLEQFILTEDTAGLQIEESVVEGKPKDEILKIIKEKDIDLLVMTAHEQEHIEHIISGREIRDLVRKMPCSLFLVRRELEYKRFVD